MTGRLGAEGSTDELDAYLQTMSKSIVLKNEKSEAETGAKQNSRAGASGGYSNRRITDECSGAGVKGDPHQTNVVATEHDNDRASQEPTTSTPVSTHASSQEDEAPGVLNSEELNEVEDDCYDDDDSLNPFAESYEPPTTKYSLESSLASLRSEPDNGFVQDVHVHTDEMCDVDEPDSPVSLSGYECLEMDSIPKYLAFKPSALTKKQHAKNTVAAIEGRSASEEPTPPKYSTTDVDNWSPTRSHRGDGPISSSCSSLNSEPATAEDGRRQRTKLVMDMNYSYDFQREVAWNPFVSPPAAERQLLPQVVENPHAQCEEGSDDRSVEYSGSQFSLEEDGDVDSQRVVSYGDRPDDFEPSEVQTIKPMHSQLDGDRISCQESLPNEVTQALERVITEIDGASSSPEFFDAEDGGDEDIQTLMDTLDSCEDIVESPTPVPRAPDSTTLMMIEPTD